MMFQILTIRNIILREFYQLFSKNLLILTIGTLVRKE